MERVGEPVVGSHGSTMIAAPKPISQAEPDHWHTKADRSMVTAADLEAIREKYQVPAEIELLLPMSTEMPSDARSGEFSLYEEALKGGLRLPLPQVVVDVLNRLEVAPDQLMPNAWKILLVCARGGVSLTTAIYHARAVAGRLEGEEGPARVGADRLVGIVEEAALRLAARFNEAELLRELRVTTSAGPLLRKAGAAKLKANEAKAQLARLKKESANWESAHAELQTVKVELENTRRQVVSLEFQLASEQKRLDDAQKAYAVAVKRHEEAMSSNEELVRQKDEANVKIDGLQKELEGERAKAVKEKESLRKELEAERAKAAAEKESLQKELEAEKAKATAEKESLQKELEAEKAKATAERATLDKELAEERAKAASERAAYPDLYVAAMDQFKGSAEFQMAVDAAVASSLAME
ncbi:uncharacterized protein LOC114307325 [Camellia sinensis]|uniref:uncharacterized protein LOC114307325 n=1 Tax=Camellia sinensis TaxID=4442 RepID=UPI0010367A6A|nr:uncharacterized protein LOC114307325 [Camellia sinensis]